MLEKNIIITIDTEVGEKAKYVKDGFEKFIRGKIGNECYGVPKIIEILDEFGFKAEFFVDVYEYKFFGEGNYRDLCRYLYKKGHGVQLHTHPSYAYDTNRINMYEYSLEEQTKIIEDGKKLIEKWIGKSSIAHRAGNYGADNNTLIALKENGIKIDSSFFYKHPNCKIKLDTINDPVKYSGVLEIPITVIKRHPKIFRIIPILFKPHWVKLDFNWISLKELKKSIKNVDSKYIILFLHSFSFLKIDRPTYNIIKPDDNIIVKFKELLYFIKTLNFDVCLFRDILKYD